MRSSCLFSLLVFVAVTCVHSSSSNYNNPDEFCKIKDPNLQKSENVERSSESMDDVSESNVSGSLKSKKTLRENSEGPVAVSEANSGIGSDEKGFKDQLMSFFQWDSGQTTETNSSDPKETTEPKETAKLEESKKPKQTAKRPDSNEPLKKSSKESSSRKRAKRSTVKIEPETFSTKLGEILHMRGPERTRHVEHQLSRYFQGEWTKSRLIKSCKWGDLKASDLFALIKGDPIPESVILALISILSQSQQVIDGYLEMLSDQLFGYKENFNHVRNIGTIVIPCALEKGLDATNDLLKVKGIQIFKKRSLLFWPLWQDAAWGLAAILTEKKQVVVLNGSNVKIQWSDNLRLMKKVLSKHHMSSKNTKFPTSEWTFAESAVVHELANQAGSNDSGVLVLFMAKCLAYNKDVNQTLAVEYGFPVSDDSQVVSAEAILTKLRHEMAVELIFGQLFPFRD